MVMMVVLVPTLMLVHLQNLPLWQKAVAGLSAGGIGALVGSPADLTLIRMQVGTSLHQLVLYRIPLQVYFLCINFTTRSAFPSGISSQADSTLPLEHRRNYKGVGDAFVRSVPWFLQDIQNIWE